MSVDRRMTKGWDVEKSTKRKVTWTTNNPKLIAELASFELLKRMFGFQASKGYKPRSVRQVRSVLILAPPCWLTWSMAADGVLSSQMFCNVMILNRHGRLTLTEAHPSKGRVVRAFEGYSDRAEDKLLLFARKQVAGLVEKRGRTHFDPGLLLAVETPQAISFTSDEAEMRAAVEEITNGEEMAADN